MSVRVTIRSMVSYSLQSTMCRKCECHDDFSRHPNSTKGNSEGTVAQANEETNRLNAALAAALERRNTLVPISRIPPEVLTSIFKYLVHYHSQPDGYVQDQHWMAFSHVCRAWRAYALACATLWSNLPCITGSPDLTEEFLFRSKSVPLTIVAPPCLDQGLRIVSEHPSRISRIAFRFRTDDETTFALTRMQKPANMLESLTLEATAQSRGYFEVIPDTFLSQHAPNLRSLTLKCIVIHSSSPLLRGLTSLSLRGWPRTPSPFMYKETLATLNNSPALRTLKLYNWLPDPEIAVGFALTATALPQVNLLYLQHLVLDATPSACADFLDRVTLPARCSVSLICWRVHEEEEDEEGEAQQRLLRACGKAISRRIKSAEQQPLLEASFIMHRGSLDFFSYAFAQAPSVMASSPEDLQRTDQTCLSLSAKGVYRPVAALAELCWTRLPWEHLRVLQLGGWMESTEAFWPGIEITLPSVETVFAKDVAAYRFLETLYRSKTKAEGQSDHWPALRNVKLTSLNFARACPRCQEWRPFEDLLAAAAKGSAERGIRLTVRTHGCTPLRPDILSGMREHVRSIEETNLETAETVEWMHKGYYIRKKYVELHCLDCRG